MSDLAAGIVEALDTAAEAVRAAAARVAAATFVEEEHPRGEHGKFTLKEVQDAVAAVPTQTTQGPVIDTGERTGLWHLTDDPNFRPDPHAKPEWNSLAGDLMGDARPEGLFVGDPEYWMHAYQYERPFVAEIVGKVTDPPGTVMHQGRENFVQGDDMHTARVLTIDEYAREHYNEPGWVEEYHDPGPSWGPGSLRDRLNIGPDYKARTTADMTQAELADYEQRFNEYAHRPGGPLTAAAFDESLHPRDRGRFTFKDVVESASTWTDDTREAKQLSQVDAALRYGNEAEVRVRLAAAFPNAAISGMVGWRDVYDEEMEWVEDEYGGDSPEAEEESVTAGHLADRVVSVYDGLEQMAAQFPDIAARVTQLEMQRAFLDSGGDAETFFTEGAVRMAYSLGSIVNADYTNFTIAGKEAKAEEDMRRWGFGVAAHEFGHVVDLHAATVEHGREFTNDDFVEYKFHTPKAPVMMAAWEKDYPDTFDVAASNVSTYAMSEPAEYAAEVFAQSRLDPSSLDDDARQVVEWLEERAAVPVTGRVPVAASTRPATEPDGTPGIRIVDMLKGDCVPARWAFRMIAPVTAAISGMGEIIREIPDKFITDEDEPREPRRAYAEDQERDDHGRWTNEPGRGDDAPPASDRPGGKAPKADRPPGTLTKKGVVCGDGSVVKIGDKVAVSIERGLSFDRFRSTSYGKAVAINSVGGIGVKFDDGSRRFYPPDDVSTGATKIGETKGVADAVIFGDKEYTGKEFDALLELAPQIFYEGDKPAHGLDLGKGDLGDLAKAFGASARRAYVPWDPEEHPRGEGGRFVTVGDGTDLPVAHSQAAPGEFDTLVADLREEAAILADRAARVEPTVSATLQSIVPSGAELVGFDFRLKGENRMAEKLAEKHVQGLDDDVAIGQIADALRYTVTDDPEDYTGTYRQVTDGLKRQGYQLVEGKEKNFWDRGDAYSGINTQWVTGDGQKFELQFHTPESFQVKEAIHDDYDTFRTSTDHELRAELWDRMVNEWEDVPIPPDVFEIGTRIKETFTAAAASEQIRYFKIDDGPVFRWRRNPDGLWLEVLDPDGTWRDEPSLIMYLAGEDDNFEEIHEPPLTASARRAYSPDQPREHGRFSFAHGDDTTTSDTAGALDRWVGGGASGDISAAARFIALRGMTEDEWVAREGKQSARQEYQDARSLIDAIPDAPRVSEMFRGILNQGGVVGGAPRDPFPLEVGATYREPLASWSTDRGLADTFQTGESSGGASSRPDSAITVTVKDAPGIPAPQVSPDERVSGGTYRVLSVAPTGTVDVESKYNAASVGKPGRFYPDTERDGKTYYSGVPSYDVEVAWSPTVQAAARRAYSPDQPREHGRFTFKDKAAEDLGGGFTEQDIENFNAVNGIQPAPPPTATDRRKQAAEAAIGRMHAALPGVEIDVAVPDLLGRPSGKSGMDYVNALNGAATGIERMAQEYPEIATRLGTLTIGPTDSAGAFGQYLHEGSDHVYEGIAPPGAYGGTPRPEIQIDIKGMVAHAAEVADVKSALPDIEEPILPRTIPARSAYIGDVSVERLAEGVAVHEWGHAVYYAAGESAVMPPTAEAFSTGQFNANISEYAGTNPHEYFAEAFAAQELGMGERLNSADRNMLQQAGVDTRVAAAVGAVVDPPPDDFEGSIIWEYAAEPRTASVSRFARRAYAEGQARDAFGRFDEMVDLIDPVSGAIDAERATMSAFPEKTQAKILNSVRERISDPPDAITDRYRALMEKARLDGNWEAGMRWYGDAHDDAAKLAADHETPMENVAGGLAAMSPGTYWVTEVEIADAMLRLDDEKVNLDPERLDIVNTKMDNYGLPRIENGTAYADLDPRSAVITMQQEYMAGEHEMPWGVGYSWDNYARGLELMREDQVDERLNGVKVRSFFNNIADPTDPDSITIDIKMVQAAADPARNEAARLEAIPSMQNRVKGIDNDSTTMGVPSASRTVTNPDGSKTVLKTQIGPTPYIADVLRGLADEYGITPNQAQAIVWTEWGSRPPTTEAGT